jgi:hypothetical protein
MITRIIDLLKSNEWVNVSETVEIAKGKNELAKDLKSIKNKTKRIWLSKRL